MAAAGTAAAPEPQPTTLNRKPTQGRKRSSRKRPTPFEAGRKPSDFEEDMYGDEDDDVDVDDNNEEERLRAAALNRQRWPRE